MKFRPCIDIHNGKVKQIVGGSLVDRGDSAEENFVAEQEGDYYAKLYEREGLKGGHVIMLNPPTSEFYEATKEQARKALGAYPGGLQIGGGMNAGNGAAFLDMGASHVIVTSYVFKDGRVSYENLEKMKAAVGKERLVLDLSCRKKDGEYYIVTDRWQKFTDVILTGKVLAELASYCDEFLVHAVDVEGKTNGIEEDLVRLLARHQSIATTYAGGVGSFEDLEKLKVCGENRIDVTIGSALDLFGGTLEFAKVMEYLKK